MKMFTLRGLLKVLPVCGVLLAGANVAAEQVFPAHQIELVVPYGAGGGTDAMARIVGRRVSTELNVPVVVVNKPGAAGAIGTRYALDANDGYRIAAGGNSNLGPLVAIGTKPPYTLDDVASIARAVENPLLIVTKAGRFKDFDAFLSEARAKPDTITFGSWGYKSPAHLYGELFVQTTGAKLRHIPFDGGTKAMLSALAGHTDIGIVTIATAKGQLQKGALVALAITSEKRSDELPQIPTVSELGFKDASYVTFDGFVASAKAPKAHLAVLRDAFQKALNDPSVQEQLKKAGSQPGYLDGPHYDDFMRRNVALQKRVADHAGITE